MEGMHVPGEQLHRPRSSVQRKPSQIGRDPAPVLSGWMGESHTKAMPPPHHGTRPSSLEYVPVGAFASISARRTGSRAPCSTVRVPSKLLRSVAVKPGHAAFTLMPADSSSAAKAMVMAFSAVFDQEYAPNIARRGFAGSEF